MYTSIYTEQCVLYDIYLPSYSYIASYSCIASYRGNDACLPCYFTQHAHADLSTDRDRSRLSLEREV